MDSIEYDAVKPFDFHGLTIRELTPASLHPLSIAEIEVAPGVRHPLARSSQCEKVYHCTEGSVHFQVEGNSVRLKRGDVLHIDVNEWFSYVNEQEIAACMVLVHCPPFNLEAEEFCTSQQ